MKRMIRSGEGMVGLRSIHDMMAGNREVADKITGDIPIELCRVPGLLARHVDYTLSRSYYPHERIAFVGALAFLSFAAGRGYKTVRNLYTNLYLVAVANSGAGKDESRKVNDDIAKAVGAMYNVESKIASGEGLEDAIVKRAKLLLQYDEYDTLVRAIKSDTSGKMEYMVGVMLSAFSSAGGYMKGRKKADSVNATQQGFCIHPCFTLYGTTIQEHLYKAFNERSLSNGFVARSLIVNCGTRPHPNPLYTFSEPPKDLIDEYQGLFGCVKLNESSIVLPDAPTEKRIGQYLVNYDQKGLALKSEFDAKWDDEYHALDDGDHAAEQSIIARRGELAEKLAMLYAISVNRHQPVMTEAAVRWASDFVSYVQGQMIEAARLYNAADDFDDLGKRILRMFARREVVTTREIARGLRRRMSDINDAIETLTTAGEISSIDGGNSFKRNW